MDKSTARVVKKVLIAVALVWIGAMGWMQFGNLSSEEVLTPHSAAVRDRMDTECNGTFGQRYDCKESIVISTVRHSLANMAMRLGIVAVVPVLLTLAFQHLTRPGGRLSPGGFVPKPTRAAQRTFSSRPNAPAPRVAAIEVEEEPAAEDDMSWKKTAQRHVTQGKTSDDV